MMELFVHAAQAVCTGKVLLMMLAGITGGMAIGALPGLTATMGVAILVPFTFTLEPLTSLAMLVGIYIGAIQGGSIPAVLIRTPGTPAAAATTFDGYPLALKGEADKALASALFASFFGGMVGTIILSFSAPLISRVALQFSAAEYCTFGIFGLSVIISLSRGGIVKGLIAGVFGLLLATVGMDKVTGSPRFTFNSIELMSGISFIPVMIGLFAVSEIYHGAEKILRVEQVDFSIKRIIPTFDEFRQILTTLLRSSFIGTFVGSLPGAGGDIAAFISYNEAKRFSKHPEEFGRGEINGIAASESANNATCEGAMIPLLTLGVPGDSVTAVLIGAFMIQGLQPGPLLFAKNSDLVYAIFVAFFVANILNYIVALIGARVFAKAVSIPRFLLLPAIMLLCIIGSYSIRNSFFDVWVMLIFGSVGYVMQKFQYPIGPVVLALILGPMVESEFRRAMIMYQKDYTIFFVRPISLIFLTLALISIFGPAVRNILRERKRNL
ncbi:C4-dicarboxylate ABC transporter permease [candidate division KSB3 bacterium]|uniref:C4-dicarboxylate ABC transporter permease n=1 Tax=candidate division KSB3 bacterium TaxID=2044937 RepID=A0A2G6E2U9_9BACT|nr:MAG: C4-dicarboxylate ABC transporter permease [candidate division KSB3 bacterium]PIE28885.1 MAG: C4-dicarboxylate ABC transporter permease [candidate division KSB3 bacterium]